ncbi:hypothetical protein ACEQ8H_006236 [Pleosporales sp. CAS-2024a]
MTPRTRNGNRKAEPTVYCSKKVPQQTYFPHRRKTVRRPPELVQDGSEKMRAASGEKKLQRVNTIQDSENESEAALEEDSEHQPTRIRTAKAQAKKRSRSILDADDGSAVKMRNPTPKRRRTATPRSIASSKRVKAESEDGQNSAPASAGQKAPKHRTLKRQSTMTQLVDGRRPLSDTEEPEFKPIKRRSRLSWSGQKSKTRDKQQRTLTQMIPGMRPLGALSDSEMEAGATDAETEEKESQAYGEAIAARFAQEGGKEEQSHCIEQSSASNTAPCEQSGETHSRERNKADDLEQVLDVPLLVLNSVEDLSNDDEEESYQPTQFIDAPITRTRRSFQQTGNEKQDALRTAVPLSTNLRTKRESKFGLLATPEKRRIREIPSSQSPADSPLSTQGSPSKRHRSPLAECSSNNSRVADTPTRSKQVTFRGPFKGSVSRPALRRFRSTIQDSEDENEDEDLIETQKADTSRRMSVDVQSSSRDSEVFGCINGVGKETQIMLAHIDEACTRPGGATDQSCAVRQASQKSSLEQGQIQSHASFGEDDLRRNVRSSERTPRTRVAEQEWGDVEVLDFTTQAQATQAEMSSIEQVEAAGAGMELPVATNQVPSSPPLLQQRVEETYPSTPMVIMDLSDEEDQIASTLRRTGTSRAPQTFRTDIQHSSELDEQLMQVPQSQRDTQQSHSSKAEQQLHNEWFSYSQYVQKRPPASSSMDVAHDKFSYHATPMPPQTVPRRAPNNYTSQATTVDEVTPRKRKTQHVHSANTTPHKVASSQSVMSPSKPPPLFIPSSFPSPNKARMEEWSSPVMGYTQMISETGGSLEDFSIPPPPPVEDDWMKDSATRAQ